MKKVLCVLLVIVVIFALAAAGGYGYAWYRSNHIFIADEAYPLDAESLDLRGTGISVAEYESIRSQMPNCNIVWDVPFQGGTDSSDSTSLRITTLTEEDIRMLDYFPNLKTVDASGCQEYAQLEALKDYRPGCEVTYQVTLGAKHFTPDTTEMTLENGDYDFAVMMENLKYLPNVRSITLRMPELSLEQIGELRSAYEEITVSCTVELLGGEYDTQTTELDLSALTSGDVQAVAEKLTMLPGLTNVELMTGEGTSELSKEDVKVLQTAAPDAVFHYTFDFYGETISTTDEEVYLYNKKIGDAGVDEVRKVLDIMENCDRFVLEYCQISNDVMAQLRDEYRDNTKLVWRIFFGQGSCMTDVDAIRAVYDLVDDNCHDLIYCEDVKYMDLGHNEYLDAVPFVAGMPNLEYIILSGSPIKDLTPFENCKNLKFLEIACCGYINDLSPLANCTSLELLNVAETKVSDLTPLDGLPLTTLCAQRAKVSQEERDRFAQQNPNCLALYSGNHYGEGWRYVVGDPTEKLPYYAMLTDIFNYTGNAFNHTGKYTDITLADYLPEEPAAQETEAASTNNE